MKNIITILTDWWGEILIYQLEKFLPNIKIERLNKWLLWKKSFDWWELNNALKMRSYEDDNTFDILHYNNWLDPIICKIPKNKITIFQSHSIHFWLDLKNTLYDLETGFKKFLGFFIHFIYKIFFYFKIKKFDLYFTSIPAALPYAIKFRKDAIWLPNAIDFELFDREYETIELDKNYINIFLPSAIRIQKNQQKAWEIIDIFCRKHQNIKIYMIRHSSSNYKLVKMYLEKYKDNIIWLPIIERIKIWSYYKTDWDLVLWSLWYSDDYAMLNMMELEAMACKSPIVAMDSFEIIKTKYSEIDNLALKLLEDKDFKNEYIEKNYEYVKKIHSLENIAEIYLENLKPFLKSKLNLSEEEINSLSINI